MINKIMNEIKSEYRKSKVITGFMGLVVLLALLTYLKPGSTSGILTYIGITVANFLILAIIVVGIWWFWWRKRKI